MMIKLLCIDPLENYDIIDVDILRVHGIETVFASKLPPKINAKINPQYVYGKVFFNALLELFRR